MSSSTSPWTAFINPDRPDPSEQSPRKALRAWQTNIAFPMLLAVLIASAASPLLHLFLNPDFGLTKGRPAPSMVGFAVVGLMGFWVTRWIGPRVRNMVAWTAISTAFWAVSFSAWMLVQPHYGYREFLKHPAMLVGERGYLVVPMFLSFGAWWLGARYGSDARRFMPEEIRSLVQRCWLVLVGSILLASLVRGSAGQAAIDAARLSVPLCMVASLALVAGTEIDATRRVARRRGGDVPGWGRWYRLTGGFALAILVLTGIVLGILSPGAMRAILDTIQTGLRGIGWVLGYILYAIVYVLYVVVRAVTAVLEWLFGDIFGPVEMPQQNPPAAPTEQSKLPEQQEIGPWPYASLLRWAAIGIAILVVAFVIFRMTRRGDDVEDEGSVDEERESLFSGDLARRQLRDLFRRKPGPDALVRLDLNRPPTDAREAMVYLEVLANREGIGRCEDETSIDFVGRLRAHWAGSGGDLGDLLAGYQPVRYGEVSEPVSSSPIAAAWAAIWAKRRATTEPPSPGRRT